jgi:iron complex outermembrane receptor protein
MTRSRKRKLARTRTKWASMPLASAMLSSGGLAYAAADTADTTTLEEVVVTAQKRSEDLQKVPISLQVLGGEKLEQLQVSDFDDYAKLLPSLSYRSNGPGQTSLFFRGISSSNGNIPLHAGFLPSSGLYLDDTPVTTVAGALDIHVYDIARIEALAGPQGTLYGASSLSGTLRIITNAPDPSAFSAGYDVKGDKWKDGAGGGGVEGFMNIPLADHAAIRIVGYASHDGGYINNVYRQDTFQRYSPTGTPVAGGPAGGPDGYPDYAPVTINNANVVQKDFNPVDTAGGRAALKIDLNDQWTVTPMVIGQHQKSSGDFAYDPHFGDLNVADYYRGYNKDDWYQSALTVEGKISNWDLTYTGGYFSRQVDNLVDYSQYSVAYDRQAIANSYAYTRFIDASGHLIDRPVQYTQNADKYEKVSHEFRVTSPADYRLRGTAGVFYQRQSDDIRAGFDLPDLPVFYEVAGQQDVYYLSQMTRTDRDYAAFGEFTFDITDQLKVVGGIREFWVNNTLDGFFGFNDDGYSTHSGEALCLQQGNPIVTTPGVYTGGPQPCNNTNKKVVEHGETHKVSLQYQITPPTWLTSPGPPDFDPAATTVCRRRALTMQTRSPISSWDGRPTGSITACAQTAPFSTRNGSTCKPRCRASTASRPSSMPEMPGGGVESELEWAATEHLIVSAAVTGLLRMETTSVFCEPTHWGWSRKRVRLPSSMPIRARNCPERPRSRQTAPPDIFSMSAPTRVMCRGMSITRARPRTVSRRRASMRATPHRSRPSTCPPEPG